MNLKLLSFTYFFSLFCFINSYSQEIYKKEFYFKKGKVELNETQKNQLETDIDSLKPNDDCIFKIKGFADNEGNRKNNLKLSAKRAELTANYLRLLQIDSNKIISIGAGQIGDSSEEFTVFQRNLNRKIVISCNCIKGLNNFKRHSQTTPTKFENDTIIYAKNGTQLKIKEGSFYPKKIKDVKITINEIFSLCDSIPDELETVSETGVCLASGGMVFLQAEYKKKRARLNGRALFEVKIPVMNNDTSFKFFIAVRQRNGRLRWKERKGEILNENGKIYYVFETNTLGGFNVDMKIPGCNMNDSNFYTLKTWTKNSRVRFYVNNQFSFFTAREIKYRKFAIPASFNPENIYVSVYGTRFNWNLFWSGSGYSYITHRVYKLSEMKYKKRRKMYKLKFKHLELGEQKRQQDQIKKAMNCK